MSRTGYLEDPISRKQLEQSYRHCQKIARKTGRNFYYSFLVLPADQRRAMCALYTFMRKTDDLGDSDLPASARREQLRQWRTDLGRAVAGDAQTLAEMDAAWPALADVVHRFKIPLAALHAVIDGCESDLDVCRYQSFEELYEYCYRVASAVGLACIRIWGAADPAADAPAEKCGVAFQLTNILRDVVEDAARGRIYLPLQELERFGVSEDDLREARYSPSVEELLCFQIERAESYYREAEAIFQYLPPAGQAVQRAMMNIYHELLRKIARDPSAVFRRRVSLSAPRKLLLVASALHYRFLR